MSTLKYHIIKDKTQYDAYCKALEELLGDDPTKTEEVELLTSLIEHYDVENNSFLDVEPISLLKSFMRDRGWKPKDLTQHLGVSKGYVSDILNY